MASRTIRRASLAPSPTGTLTAGGGHQTLVAAGSEMTAERTAETQYVNIGWQRQAWAYFAAIGPLNYGLTWLSNAMSRVALVVAEVHPGNEEPEILEDGPAVEILNQLKWDESAIMADLTIQMSVPGRGYLVGTELGPGVRDWKVYSPDQIRPAQANRSWEWELWELGKQWIPLQDALVAVIRDGDDRYDWVDNSTVRAALGVLREIDLYDKEIISSLVSRIANNGILLVPQEVTFPTRAGFNDNTDPFMQMLVETARQSIKDPGSASAAIPMPIKVPAQFIEKFRHLIVAAGVDDKVLNAREKAFNILAGTVNLPKEIMLGMGDANHWSAWQLEDSAIKTHISPVAEVLCRGLTLGFLYPQLKAANAPLVGPNGGRLVVWYDPAALTMRPDLSERAVALYDRDEISGEALRRETGFTDDDAPDAAQLREQVLKKLAKVAQHALRAVEELTGEPVGEPEPVVEVPAGNGAIGGDEAETEEQPTPERPTARKAGKRK